MRSPRYKIRGNGRRPTGTITYLAQGNDNQVHELGRNNDNSTGCDPVSQELERLKQRINWKVENIEAGYDILLSHLETDNPEYVRLNTMVEQTIAQHATISQKMVQALGAAPAAQ